MSRVMEEGSTYYEQPTVQKVGPIKWMAPEQIERHVYSKATDVYSFGVLLYEIFAKEAPWSGINNLVACQKVLNGECMKPPNRTPRPLRKKMQPRLEKIQPRTKSYENDQSTDRAC